MWPISSISKPILIFLIGVFLFVTTALHSIGSATADQLSDTEIVGEMGSYTTRYDDSLLYLARRFDLGFIELIAANPEIDPWLPGEGLQLVLPMAHLLPNVERRGIVINLAELRLYFFAQDGTVVTYPVGIGRSGWETPEIETTVVAMRERPVWVPPPSIRSERPGLPTAVPPGPGNPLGAYAIDLAYGTYVIHGTNNPPGVGRRVSHGCIRLYPEDIEELFQKVKPGTLVRIVKQEAKLGWVAGDLYLEVHPTPEQADAIEAGGTPPGAPEPPMLNARITNAIGPTSKRLNPAAVRKAVRERNGIPVRITHPVNGEPKR